MELHRAIIHNVIKNQGQMGAVSELSETVLPVDQMSSDLVERLSEVYRSKNTTYAKFNEEDGKIFPARFAAYALQPSDDEMVQFSQATTLALRDTLEPLAPARGGYLLFADYTSQAKRFVSVLLIRNTTGVFFDHDAAAHTFRINPTVHIDLEKLAMACRINLSMHADRSGKYLNFIKYNVRELATYFTAWIAAVEREDSTTYTKALYTITRDIPCPLDDNGNAITRDELRRRIYTYADSQPARIVNLRSLSETLYGDPDTITQFAETQDILIDVEFKPDTREMKRFVKVDLRGDGIQMQFPEGALGTRVRPVLEDENMIVVESAMLAKQLRDEIDARR